MVLPSAVMGQLSRDLCSCFTLRTGRPGRRVGLGEGGAEDAVGPGLSAPTPSYLSVFGGACRAPSAISSSSAATRASTEGGVGKGKLTTWTQGQGGTRE